jgi:hypothetical protein
LGYEQILKGSGARKLPVSNVQHSVAVVTIYLSLTTTTLLWHKQQGHKSWKINHVLAIPSLRFSRICHNLLPMKQQGTVKFSQDASQNLGSLRPIVAQREARYDVENKCVGSIVNPFIKD